MSDHPVHQTLELYNFTAFREVKLEFASGINVFVGENGTGKTHIMKALYAFQLSEARDENIRQLLKDLFQTKSVDDLIRQGTPKDAPAEAHGLYGKKDWAYAIHPRDAVALSVNVKAPAPSRPVFIPAIDMMGHTKGFSEAYEEVRLDFDRTCIDIVRLMALERSSSGVSLLPDVFTRILGGELEQEKDGRFYLVNEHGRLPMPIVAEGLRKIATLVRLSQNGWLTPGTTLFWDEPEVNLNPILMDEVIGAVLAMARSGVQVFLATHSYVILKELDLQATEKDDIRFFSFQPGEQGTIVSSTDEFTSLQPNAILDQYNSLYDRELTRATGRNRRGERVR